MHITVAVMFIFLQAFTTVTVIPYNVNNYTWLPNTNQKSWRNVANFSYISVGNFVIFASQFPLYSIILFLFATIESYKMFIAIINKKHNKVDNELEYSESLLPVRRATGSDYGTMKNIMVI